jgi:hypothetical protein
MKARHGRSLARETAAKALRKLHEAMTLALVSVGHAEAAPSGVVASGVSSGIDEVPK